VTAKLTLHCPAPYVNSEPDLMRTRLDAPSLRFWSSQRLPFASVRRPPEPEVRPPPSVSLNQAAEKYSGFILKGVPGAIVAISDLWIRHFR